MAGDFDRAALGQVDNDEFVAVDAYPHFTSGEAGGAEWAAPP